MLVLRPMKRALWVVSVVIAASSAVAASQRRPLADLRAELTRLVLEAAGPRPAPPNLPPNLAWAYYIPDPNPPLADVPETLSLPGSSQTFARADLFDPYRSLDWLPNEHAPMPAIVARGRMGAIPACTLCHGTAGMGHPSSANLTGLSVGYLTRQLNEFKSGARKGWPMSGMAAHLTDDEIRQAVEWFASLTFRSSVRVVEAGTAPVFFTTPAMRMPVPGGAMEPLGNRIVEVPEDPVRAAIGDPHSGEVAYVPLGAIKRGEVLVQSGGAGKTLPCTLCHGADLRGIADIPRIAGRVPSSTVRQLIAIQTGTRAGSMHELMKPVVEHLTPDDMIAIAAYVASREP